jgi:hypothetical protein
MQGIAAKIAADHKGYSILVPGRSILSCCPYMCITWTTILGIVRHAFAWFVPRVIGSTHTTERKFPMSEHKFQWSVFVDPSRQEQYVVRCDDFADFLEGIELVKTLLPHGNGSNAPVFPEAEPEVPVDQCAIHNKPMKLRNGKTGNQWWDHRWKVETPNGDVWYVCNGQYEKVQANGKS